MIRYIFLFIATFMCCSCTLYCPAEQKPLLNLPSITKRTMGIVTPRNLVSMLQDLGAQMYRFAATGHHIYSSHTEDYIATATNLSGSASALMKYQAPWYFAWIDWPVKNIAAGTTATALIGLTMYCIRHK